MLSKNQVVAIRKIHEKNYGGICTIIEYQKTVQANKSTGFVEVVVLENQSCKLSFKNLNNAKTGDVGTTVEQTITILISPDIVVKSGSKLIITQNGETKEYKNSGEPARFPTHQEISLELFKGWT